MINKFEVGQPFETTVVAVAGDTVFIDLSAKSEGLVDAADFTDADGNVTVKEGDKVTVYFTGDVRGEMHFTAKLAGQKADTSMLENAFKNQIPVEGSVTGEIKGGFEVKIGSTRAFCPYSQMGFKDKKEPSYYIGRTMTFVVTEYKNDGKNLIVSNRKIGESEYANQLGKLASQITEGAVLEGTVESLEKFGAFVNVLGFRTLLPISEMSLDRVSDPADVVKEGEKITVKVLKTDWKNERVSVSLKALIADPWENAESQFPIGTKIDGKIVRIADFGVFVNLASGIDGLVHISELEGVKAGTNLKKVYSVGQNMSVVVEKVDAEAKRISLKPASSAEQDTTAASYLSSQKDDGETYNPFAAFFAK